MNKIKYYIVSGIISLVACLLIIAHLLVPNIKIDGTVLVLFLFLIMPWLLPYIKSFEIPNLLKIELPSVKAATDKITKNQNVIVKVPALEVGMQAHEPKINIKSFYDPNLALVGIRIEIEKKLNEIYEKGLGQEKRKSLGSAIKELQDKGLLSKDLGAGLRDLITLGNCAAHGSTVSQEAAEYAVEHAPVILNILDDVIHKMDRGT